MLRSNGALSQMALTILASFEIPATPSYLAVAPISHVTGTNLVPVFLKGGTTHLLRQFEPERMLATVQRERVDFALVVPTMVYRLLDDPALPRFDLSSLELLLYGASPMAPSRLAEALERIGPVFSQLYGQSECYPIASLPKADHDPARPDLLAACGFPTANTDVALLDAEGAPAVWRDLRPQPDHHGRVLAAARADRGSLCRRDAAHGRHRHGGRGGPPHHRGPQEGFGGDRRLQRLPAGGRRRFGGPSGRRGGGRDRRAGPALGRGGEGGRGAEGRRAREAAELIDLVRERKGPVMAPKLVEFAESLPLTPLGKLDKKALRVKSWAGQGRNVA